MMLYFNGQDSYVDVNVQKAITLETFAIETWIYADNFDNWRVICNTKGWTQGYVHYQFR